MLKRILLKSYKINTSKNHKKLCKINHKLYKGICASKIISNQFNTSKNPNTSNTLCK